MPPADDPSLSCRELLRPNEYFEKSLGRWIKANTKETDMVLVAGYGAVVQAYSERISPSVYFNVTQTKAAKERFVKDMAAGRPAMVLVPAFLSYRQLVAADIRNVIDEMITQRYRFDRCMYGYNVYRLTE